ncbi:ABC-2 type transport system ATP-binding protein [Anaerobacterium chartisolvens]|uniref:ABC-2 type transport system ATP-binding protein n=1 Tax=Anaerobacterium chartisolvens TaxID=1297424 RepID=A0A369B4R3_9FIRM|nr:ABC transporter ATP-binding protein [Anaerobacterium chartisolvens]RCX16295.1 ABC-2 type transport system ATP-binding protein [Anaerobacterium chartisolvens]
MNLIEVKDVSKRFGSLIAVNGVSFEVKSGEVFGLLGPNGAGKSTLISMVTTLVRPDSGRITIDGNDVMQKSKEARKAIGLVPQEIALYPTLSARDNLVFWGRMYGLGGKLLDERVDMALEIAGLKDRQNDRIETYSGGMKRRINIAAALLHKPKILVMDEPTVGIDPQSRNHILESVLNLNKEGMTIIYTSHYMEEVEYLCSRIAIMDHGKIIASGSKEELRKLVGEFDVINVDIANPPSGLEELVQPLKGITKVILDGSKLSVYGKESGAMLAPLISILDESNCKIHNIGIQESNLESVFLHLTGRALRD